VSHPLQRGEKESKAGFMKRPVRTIDRNDLSQKLARHEPIKLVMALNEWAFHAKHIPGSLRFDTEEEILANLRKDDEIVVYCSNVACHASIALYHFLVDHGFTNVRRYDGGIVDWEAAGLPLEGEWIKGPAGSETLNVPS
jgi:rhodanese-related sulfurtransferase